jgi:hypothetical protein
VASTWWTSITFKQFNTPQAQAAACIGKQAMTRDPTMPAAWYDQWIAYDQARIDKVKAIRNQAAANPAYEPQYVYELAGLHLHLLLRRYCRGDPIPELWPHLVKLLDCWEEAEVLGAAVWSPEVQRSRQAGRPIGNSLCHAKPYQRLLSAVTGPADQRPALLHDFVTHWRAELQRAPAKGLSPRAAVHDQPYWYDHAKADGAYFGYWCLEAVAVVKAFDIDDSACLGHLHYPGDLLRPISKSQIAAHADGAGLDRPGLLGP